MRALIQRVTQASVSFNDAVHGSIDRGLLVFLGITHSDTAEDAKYLAQRCIALRIFEDQEGKMNLSVSDIGGKILAISQFTLYGDTRKGNRPSFVDAARPEYAEPLYHAFVDSLSEILGASMVASGVFRAMMRIALVNDGPVTVMLESKNKTA